MDGNVNKKRTGKTAKTRRETAVQGTNDNSIVSKCSMAATGYFEDKFLKFFVAKSSRRAPLIHRGYYIRAKTVSYIVTEFLQRYGSAYKQIVSLGCGFDSAYFRLKSSGKMDNTVYIEIDFPEVVRKKSTIIKNTPELKELLGEEQILQATSPHIEMNRCDYKILGIDLTQLNTLEAALRLCNVDFDAPTLLLSECVLTYMTRRCSSAVVRWAAETFTESVFLLYEQINPNDPFGLFMQNHYNVIGSPLKSINAFPTLESQKERFISLGWSWCEAYDMNQFYKNLVGGSEKQHINSLEPFDEYEEWHLKCSHYFVLCAYSNQCEGLLQGAAVMKDDGSNSESEFIPDLVKVLPSKLTSNVKRFSHTSTRLDDQFVVTVGGFGEQDGRHQRISEVRLIDIKTDQIQSLRPGDETVEMARMHHSVNVLDDGTLILFGGRISPFRLCSQLITLKFSKIETHRSEKDFTLNSSNSNIQPDSDTATNSAVCGTETKPRTDIHKPSCDRTSGCENVNVDLNSAVSVSPCHKPTSQKANCDKSLPSDKSVTQSDESVNIKGNNSGCEEPKFHMDYNVVEQTGDVPCLRWRHKTTRVTVEGEEFVFLYGGRNSSDAALCDSFLLDPRTGKWKQIECTGESPGYRQSHTLCTWRDQVVLCGGLDEYLLPHNTVHCLDLSTRTWRKLTVTGPLQPRYSHTAHVTDNILVVIGGVNLSHGTPGVALLDLNTGLCVEYQLPPAVKENLKMFHKHSSVVMDDGQFLIVGGGGNCFSFGSHLNASPFLLDISLCMQHFVQNV